MDAEDNPRDAVTGQPHVFHTVETSAQSQPQPPLEPSDAHVPPVPPRPVRSESRDAPREQVSSPPSVAARPAVRRVPTAVITRAGEAPPPPATQNDDINDKKTVPTESVSHTVHVPNTVSPSGTAQGTAVIPATQAHAAPEHALPTAPSVHPEAQAAQLDKATREDPALVAGEVEKAKAGRRELEGKEPKGTVVQGLEDDRLWALLRKFDEQVNHTLILTSHKLPPTEPDLRRSVLPHVPFNSDILRANMERLYAGAGIGLIRSINEIIRLRSWSPQERRRTAYFCVTYFFAWCLGLAIPTVILFLITLIVLPESRYFFFPPVMPALGQPPSATDPTNQAGDQSFLGGVDSDVQHRSKAEQIEEQAWEFRQLAEAFAVRIAVSKGAKSKNQGNAAVGEKHSARSLEPSSDSSSSETDSDSDDDFADAQAELDPSLYAPGEHPDEIRRQQKQLRHARGADRSDGMSGTMVHHRKGSREVAKPMNEKQRKKAEGKEAKRKRDEMIGKYTKMMQDVTGDIADLSECVAHALSPPRPFPPNIARFKLAGAIFAPLFLASAVVPAWIWHRAASFMLGFLFFGQPLIDRGLAWFVRAVPDWKEKLDMRNSLLSGVPTNDQLVLHLLRVGERMNHPLPRPPPPPLAGTPKEAIKDTGPDPDDDLVDEKGNPIEVDELGARDKVMHKSKSKLVNSFKSVSKRVAAIGADVTVDGVRKKVGTKVDRVVFGDVLKDDGDAESYPCKLNGKPGHIVIQPLSVYGPASITWEPLVGRPLFERKIDDIVEIKKGGVSMPRAVLGWASGADIESQTLIIRLKDEFEKQVTEISKEIKGMQAQDGDIYELNQVVRREQLFNRLIAMGNQRWESL